MRYVIASLVALLLSAALFAFHWWVSLALESEAGKLPEEGMAMKLPKHIEEMLSWDDLLYRNRFIFIAAFFVVCLGVAWRTRNRLEVR